MKLIDGIYDMDDEPVEATTSDEIYTYFNNRLQTHWQPQKQKGMNLLDSVKGMPSFANMTSEGAVLAYIRELENKATKVDALEKTVASYKEKLEAIAEKEIEAFVDKAIAEKRITNEQKAQFVALMKSDRKNTEALINSMKPQPTRRATDVYQDEGGGTISPMNFAKKSWDEIDKAGKLAELRNADFSLFKAKYKEAFGVDYKE